MSIGQKFEKVADAVYEKGKTDIISNSKYIEKQATGKVIRLDDVSEIPHKVRIRTKGSDNLFDYSSHKANGYYSEFPVIGGKTLYSNGHLGDPALWFVCDANGNTIGDFSTLGFTSSKPLILPNNVSYIKSTDYKETYNLSLLYIGYDSDTSFRPFFEPAESAEVEVYGKNLCDGILEVGSISDSTGANITTSASMRTVNYIPVLPNTTYTISREDTTKNIRTRVYDKNKNFIGFVFTARTSPFTITTKDNHAFMRLELLGVNLEEKIQFEYGNYETEHEPYVGQTITATPEGTEIDSLCPIMNIMADNDVTVDYYSSYGMQTEYDRFWNNFQYNKGLKMSYSMAFSTRRWKDDNFKPKYDIVASDMNQCFYMCDITDLAGILTEREVILDTSRASSMNYAFGYSTISRIPTIDLSMATNTTNMCANYNSTSSDYARNQLRSIEKIISSDVTTFATNSFANCDKLEHCIFEGTIAKALDIHWSTKLNRASILSLLQCLKASVTGVVVTLPAKCIDTATDTLALIQGDTELNTAYTQALANGYTISFQ